MLNHTEIGVRQADGSFSGVLSTLYDGSQHAIVGIPMTLSLTRLESFTFSNVMNVWRFTALHKRREPTFFNELNMNILTSGVQRELIVAFAVIIIALTILFCAVVRPVTLDSLWHYWTSLSPTCTGEVPRMPSDVHSMSQRCLAITIGLVTLATSAMFTSVLQQSLLLEKPAISNKTIE